MTRKQFLNEEIDSDEADGSGLLSKLSLRYSLTLVYSHEVEVEIWK